MTAASAITLSVGSATSFGSIVSPKLQSKAFVAKYNTRNYLRNFSGLKAEAFVRCESESSFLGTDSAVALRSSITPKAQKEKQRCQPLALLIKMSPLVSSLHLYDIANVKGVAADLNHCNTPAQVFDFTGASELANCLKDVDVVAIPAGVLRKPGITILPLLSKTKPSTAFTDEEVQELTVRIQNAGTENGVEALISSDLNGLNEYEQKALEALKLELKASIEKGIAYAQKETVTA
ncbi:hypothetical protein K7X08_010738 [Anisodus acutangulus]|uniref:malate dehydrogenase n=1 Tax=Anisodus acutangulus TaxID=402998 RepID=A0A9Q1LXG7_9SOLA|nr:hypothetical protein K7X08_010738 [Anisodus acutangulus]